MALKVWFEEDVRNALQAARLSVELAARANPDALSAEYGRGYGDALRVLATAFGFAELPEGVALDAPVDPAVSRGVPVVETPLR